jgi:hypothetical protein
MTASRHRRLARTGGHPPRRAPVSKRAPCYRSPAPRVNAHAYAGTRQYPLSPPVRPRIRWWFAGSTRRPAVMPRSQRENPRTAHRRRRLVQHAPRTHRDHELTCGYAIGATQEAHNSRSFLQVRAMGVQVGFRSRNDNNTLRPRRMSKLRFNGRSPLTGHRKPAQAHKRRRVIAASAVTRLSGCLPPDLVRARVSSDRRCSAATPSSCRTAARRHPQPLSRLAVIPPGTLPTVEPGLIRIDPVSQQRQSGNRQPSVRWACRRRVERAPGA